MINSVKQRLKKILFRVHFTGKTLTGLRRCQVCILKHGSALVPDHLKE